MTSPLPRRVMQGAARLLVAVLLFAQGLIAVHACTPEVRGASFAAAREAAMPCHEQPAADRGGCLSHCSSADQSLDTPQVVVAAMPATALLTLPPAVDANSMDRAMAGRDPDPGGRTLALRFRVLRI